MDGAGNSSGCQHGPVTQGSSGICLFLPSQPLGVGSKLFLVSIPCKTTRLLQPEVKKASGRGVCPRGSAEDAGKYPDSPEHCFICSFFPKEQPPGAGRREDGLSFAEKPRRAVI